MGGAKKGKYERCVLGSTGDPILEREHLERYEFAKERVRDEVVLDVSCGSGYGSRILASEAAEVVGVDLSEEALAMASERYSAPNLTFLRADATCLDFAEDGRFNAVVSFETIEHLQDHRGFLAELKRVLKDDGVLMISTPNRRMHSPGSDVPANPFHVIEFDYQVFADLLNRDFEVEEMYGQNVQNPLKKSLRAVARLVPPKVKDPVKEALCGRKELRPLMSAVSSGLVLNEGARGKHFVAVCKKR